MPGDAMKYNLRCNRNVSEKMTKKDFVYDIRPPVQNCRKPEEERYPIVLPLHLRRKQSSDSRAPPRYTVIPGREGRGENGGPAISEPRPLEFECNLCHERIATLLSLSTHIKSHRRTYCRHCYRILGPTETMEEHVRNSHRREPEVAAD